LIVTAIPRHDHTNRPCRTRQRCPGEPPCLAWLTLASLLVAGLAWYWFSSYAIPRCDTRQTVAAVTDGKFSLHDIQQAGYAWSQKTRGCLATVIEDGKPLQYAWTILKRWRHARKYCLAWFPAACC
jgi:hypothetical protein